MVGNRTERRHNVGRNALCNRLCIVEVTAADLYTLFIYSIVNVVGNTAANVSDHLKSVVAVKNTVAKGGSAPTGKCEIDILELLLELLLGVVSTEVVISYVEILCKILTHVGSKECFLRLTVRNGNEYVILHSIPQLSLPLGLLFLSIIV